MLIFQQITWNQGKDENLAKVDTKSSRVVLGQTPEKSSVHVEDAAYTGWQQVRIAINNSNNSQEVKDKQLKEVDNAYNNKNWNVLANYAAMYKLTEIENFFRKLQEEQEPKSKASGGAARSSPIVAGFFARTRHEQEKEIRKRTKDIEKEQQKTDLT